MTIYHGKDTELFVDDEDGVERDLTAWVQDFSYELAQDTADATAKGDAGKRHTVGHAGGTATASGKYDDTATSGPAAVLEALAVCGHTAEFRALLGGTGTGKRQLAGSWTCKTFSPSSPIAGTIAWTATFEFDGLPAVTVLA